MTTTTDDSRISTRVGVGLGAGLLAVAGFTAGVGPATAIAGPDPQVVRTAMSVPTEKQCNFTSLKQDGALKCSDVTVKETPRTKGQRKADAAVEACANDLAGGLSGDGLNDLWSEGREAWKEGGWKGVLKQGLKEGGKKGSRKFGPASAGFCIYHGQKAYRNAK